MTVWHLPPPTGSGHGTQKYLTQIWSERDPPKLFYAFSKSFAIHYSQQTKLECYMLNMAFKEQTSVLCCLNLQCSGIELVPIAKMTFQCCSHTIASHLTAFGLNSIKSWLENRLQSLFKSGWCHLLPSVPQPCATAVRGCTNTCQPSYYVILKRASNELWLWL